MNMIHKLMRNPSIILQNVVILNAHSFRNLFRSRQQLRQFVIRNIVELCTVGFRDNERVPPRQRLDVEEGENLRGFEKLVLVGEKG